jgi:hypothetical protein
VNGPAVGVLVAAAALGACRDSAANAGAERAVTAVAAPRAALEPTAAAALCTTRGDVRPGPSGLAVTEPTMRAHAPGADGDVAELRFVYRGPTEAVAPLGSGEVRRQLGLRLRAPDSCNAVYVMWRIDPRPALVVSVKRNRGQRLHRECGTRGYRTVRPRYAVAPPQLEVGAAHALHAAIDGSALEVRIDGEVVWRGELGADVRDLSGPPGIRTDNAAAELTLYTRAGSAAAACP